VNLDLNLNSFQTQYISEDDSSFDDIIKKQNLEKKQKYLWFYNKDTQQLLITDGKDGKQMQAIEPPKGEISTWNYTSRNCKFFLFSHSFIYSFILIFFHWSTFEFFLKNFFSINV